MPDDDPYTLAAVDASILQQRIQSETGIANDAGDGHVAARALANALVIVVQEYLEENSNEHDLDLFLEVNGRQPDDVASWPASILAGLRFRRISPEHWQSICERAVETAIRFVQSSSSLAWGR
jgi:hypothetical protein